MDWQVDKKQVNTYFLNIYQLLTNRSGDLELNIIYVKFDPYFKNSS